MGKIILLLGKSSSGKDHFYKMLKEEPALQLQTVVLYTTRPMRENEQDGVQYFFTDETKLSKLRAEGRVIEERCYQTALGPWYYFTVDDGQIDLKKGSALMIGTLESYASLCAYFGREQILPVYIETEDRIRLERAMKREEKQEHPHYDEMCRRFLADTEDFAPEKLQAAGITRVIPNNTTKEDCFGAILNYLREEGVCDGH